MGGGGGDEHVHSFLMFHHTETSFTADFSQRMLIVQKMRDGQYSVIHDELRD